MASRFASVTEEQILLINEVAVPKNKKMATTFGLMYLMGSRLSFPNSKFSTKK